MQVSGARWCLLVKTLRASEVRCIAHFALLEMLTVYLSYGVSSRKTVPPSGFLGENIRILFFTDLLPRTWCSGSSLQASLTKWLNTRICKVSKSYLEMIPPLYRVVFWKRCKLCEIASTLISWRICTADGTFKQDHDWCCSKPLAPVLFYKYSCKTCPGQAPRSTQPSHPHRIRFLPITAVRPAKTSRPESKVYQMEMMRALLVVTRTWIKPRSQA